MLLHQLFECVCHIQEADFLVFSIMSVNSY